MIVLTLWIIFAACVLVASMVVHASVILGIHTVPAVPTIMLLMIVPCGVAFLYANKLGGPKGKAIDTVWANAPSWLRVMYYTLFVYAVAIGIVTEILGEGGVADIRDGKYVISNHEAIIREITEQEYHQHQSYGVRMLSGWWMLFSSAALTLLVGTARLRRGRKPENLDVIEGSDTHSVKENRPKELPPEPTTIGKALIGLVLYLTCVLMILSGSPVLALLCVVPISASAVMALRRRRGFPHQGFESKIGCVTVLPNFFLAISMSNSVARFIYVFVFVGPYAAIANTVSVIFPEEGPAQLTDGTPLNNQVWSGLDFLVGFPLIVVGIVGLCHLAEHVGRFVEVRKQRVVTCDRTK